jgi:hypothetical protein
MPMALIFITMVGTWLILKNIPSYYILEIFFATTLYTIYIYMSGLILTSAMSYMQKRLLRRNPLGSFLYILFDLIWTLERSPNWPRWPGAERTQIMHSLDRAAFVAGECMFQLFHTGHAGVRKLRDDKARGLENSLREKEICHHARN